MFSYKNFKVKLISGSFINKTGHQHKNILLTETTLSLDNGWRGGGSPITK